MDGFPCVLLQADGGVGSGPSFCNWMFQEERTVQVTEKGDSEVGGICCRDIENYLGQKRVKINLTSFKCAGSRVLAE